MATIRRDIAPGKEKRGISAPQTATKTNHIDSSAPQKHIPNYLKATKSSTTDVSVSKQQGKKPAPTTHSPHKPTLTTRRSTSEKTPPSTQKTRVSTNSSLRSLSTLSGKTKTSVSQKPIPSKNLKTVTKDVGKYRSSHAIPVSTIRKSSTRIKKQETDNSTTSATKEQTTSTSAAKEQITSTHQVENLKIVSVQEPETRVEDQESSITVAEEQQKVQAVSKNEKGTDDLVSEEQEPSHDEIEVGGEDKDANIVIDESSTVVEKQDVSLGIKTQESEDKSPYVEETSKTQQEIEEHSMINEVNSSNNGENVSGNSNEEEAEEKEVYEVEVALTEEEKEIKEEEEAKAELNKKDESGSGSEAHESKETEEQELVDEKKQESENEAPKQQQAAQGKKDSAVSNDVIEETASKLREQRKNKVKALAGAFETVISLQETK